MAQRGTTDAPTLGMSLIQDAMPCYRLREVDHIAVAADPARAYAAVRALDLYRIPFVRRLFALRLVPVDAQVLRGEQKAAQIVR